MTHLRKILTPRRRLLGISALCLCIAVPQALLPAHAGQASGDHLGAAHPAPRTCRSLTVHVLLPQHRQAEAHAALCAAPSAQTLAEASLRQLALSPLRLTLSSLAVLRAAQARTVRPFSAPDVLSTSSPVIPLPSSTSGTPTAISSGTPPPATTGTPSPLPIGGSVSPSPSPTPAGTQGAPSPVATVTSSATPSPTAPASLPPVVGGNSATIQQEARTTLPSVLLVSARATSGLRTATGFVIRSDSTGTYVLTVARAVQGVPAARITLSGPNSTTTYQVQSLQANAKAKTGSGNDLAVLRLKPSSLAALPLGNTAPLQPGQLLLSFSYEPGLGGPPSVYLGIVSAVHRDLHDGAGPVWIQHQTPLDVAGAGAPALDLAGTVQGVNIKGKYVSAAPGARAQQLQGVFYAIPAATVRTVAGGLLTALGVKGSIPPAPSTTPIPGLASPTAQPSPGGQNGSAYAGSGYTLRLPGGWTVSKFSDGSPSFNSPDNAVSVLVQETDATATPTDDQIKQIIGKVATDLGTQLKTTFTVAYRPITIGALHGLTGMLTAADGSLTVLFSVLSDGQHLLSVQEILSKDTPQSDLDQATALINSIQVTGGGTLPAASTPTPGPGGTKGGSYSGSGYTVALPTGWTERTSSDGIPAFYSPDQDAVVNVDVEALSGTPTDADLKQLIAKLAADLGKQAGLTFTVAYRPITIGALHGLTGVLTPSDHSLTLDLSVLSDGQHLLQVVELFSKSATQQDTAQAGQLVNSIKLS